MRHDGAGVEWARAICAELRRDEESEADIDEVWHDCEEWALEDFYYDESEAEASSTTTRRIRDEMPPRERDAEQKGVTTFAEA